MSDTVEAVKLKRGDFINHQSDTWVIQKTDFYNPGKGSALMKLKIKNIASGKIIDFTYKSNESVEILDVDGSDMQLLYNDGQNLVFMDNKTFEQYELSVELVGDPAALLKDSDSYYVYTLNDVAIDMQLPGSVTLEVTRAEEVVKGNTTGDVKKEVDVETGAKIMVPAFIKTGDKVSINPETGEYRGRVNE